MSEYFELTFFLEKEKIRNNQAEKHLLGILNLKQGKSQIDKHHYPLFSGREVLFNVCEYDDADFLECTICLAEFVFTKKNFEEKIEQLLRVVDACFSQLDSVLFATGIYEMTGICIEGVSNIEDFNSAVFSKFPILFFRKGREQGFQPSHIYNDVSCIVNINEKTQNIFASPVGELMEDEGLNFNNAHLKLYDYDFVEAYAKKFGMNLEKAQEVLRLLE